MKIWKRIFGKSSSDSSSNGIKNRRVNKKIKSIEKRYLSDPSVFRGYEPVLEAIQYEIKGEDNLILVLESENFIIVAAAAEALGILKSDKAVKPIIEQIIEKDCATLAMIKGINALSMIGNKSSISSLENLLNHDDDEVKLTSKKAIEKLNKY